MSPRLARLTRVFCLVGGSLLALSVALQFVYVWRERFHEAALKPLFVPIFALELVAVALIALGLVVLYERQAQETGTLGLAGFLIAFLGTLLLAGIAFVLTFVVPEIAKTTPFFLQVEPSGTLIFGFLLTGRALALGYLVFGIATFLAGVFSKGAAVVVMVGAIISGLPGILGSVSPDLFFVGTGVLGLGLSWLGYSQWVATR